METEQLRAGLEHRYLLWRGARWVWDNPDNLSISKTSDSYIWHAYAHYPREPIDTLDDPHVNGRRIFVIGDSHSAAYRTMLKQASMQLDIQSVEYEHGGCAVVNLMDADPSRCAHVTEAALKQVEERAKPGDIVFLASLRMPELAGRDATRGRDFVFNEALSELLTPEKSELARQAAEAILARLEALNVQVLIDAPKPVFMSPPSRCSDWFNEMNPICALGMTMERQQLEQLRAPQMKLLKKLQLSHPFLHVWDPLPILCPGTVCSAYDNGKPLYFDSDHRSGHGNRVLSPSFITTIRAIWSGQPPGGSAQSPAP